MDPYSFLKRQARAKRDLAIAKANGDYQASLIAIDRLGRKLNKTNSKTRYTAAVHSGSDFSKITSARAAQLVLEELGPLTVPEIVIEAQARGFRTADPPKKVANAIRGAMKAHGDKFVVGELGRWERNC